MTLTLIVAPPARAQELGLRGGWLLTDSEDRFGEPLNPPVFVTDRESGFSVGGFAIVPLARGFALQPEVLFSRREIRIGGNPDVPTLEEELTLFAPLDATMRADYLEIPVLVRVTFGGEDEGMKPHLLLGPSLAVNLDARFEDRVFSQNNQDDITDAVSDLDASLIFGAGMTLGEHLEIDGRYNLGLTEIRDEDVLFSALVPTGAWRSFALTAGFVF